MLCRTVLVLAALAVLPLDGLAQPARTADKVAWRVRAETATPGGEARIVLDATIEEGWRLYAIDSPVGRPLVLTLDPLPEGLTAGALRQSETRTAFDAGFQQDYPYFARAARLAQTIRVGERVAPGRHLVEGALVFAVCDDSVCLPPARVPFRVPVVVR